MAAFLLLQQSYFNLEIIVIDDNSQDNTELIVNKLVKAHNNLKYIRLTENLGTYFAKNIGIQAAQGEYLFFQDNYVY